ncbi:glycosyltransferase [Marinilongibacter aquaticus]|uniref:glycosyltransferase n=1 Tax=Marinilongibacter aquaticus TaxID=2975157 RepID=UPI0021BD0334|nr:glycosyltransferase [Marinilongibacter aquaticus]UBM58906.1 glycosyltransferase [Marinilongibacter aquaticus]
MKIAFVNFDDGNGGAAKAAKRLANVLRKQKGYDVDFFVAIKGQDDSNAIQLRGEGTFFRIFNYSKFLYERLYFLFYEASKKVRFNFSPAVSGINLDRHIQLSQYDLIHLHWFNFGLLSLDTFEILLKSGKPIIWTLHDMWAFTGGCHYSLDCEQFKKSCSVCENYLRNPNNSKLALRLQERKEALYGDSKNLTLVTCSKWLQKQANESKILGDKQILQIHNCLENQEFFPMDTREAKVKLSLGEDINYVLFVADSVDNERKGFKYLLESLSYLQNVYFLVIGSVKEQNILETEQLIFLGHVSSTERLRWVYNAASVFVIPSLQDNLPNTILESFACGTPVVGFDNSGISEMISHKETGYLARNRDAKDLANGIDWIVLQNEKSRFIEPCRYFFESHFSEERVAHQYSELYIDAINRNNR